jgi:2-polyprenyl-6-methoxyphenol hydroxylase-like FAD-dependent oxidoreductase
MASDQHCGRNCIRNTPVSTCSLTSWFSPNSPPRTRRSPFSTHRGSTWPWDTRATPCFSFPSPASRFPLTQDQTTRIVRSPIPRRYATATSLRYVVANITVPAFAGWEDLTETAWIEHITRLLRSDNAHSGLIRAFEGDVIPGTVGAWQIVSCGERRVPYGACGGRVVLIGDAAHAMPPQG